MPDHRQAAVLVGQMTREGDRGADIVNFEYRIVFDDLVGCQPLGQGVEDDGDVNSCAADERLTGADLGVHKDSGEQIFIGHGSENCYSVKAPRRTPSLLE